MPSPTLARPAKLSRKKAPAKQAATGKKQSVAKESEENGFTNLPEMLAYIRKYTRWKDDVLADVLGITEKRLRLLDAKPDSVSGRCYMKVKNLYEDIERMVQKAKAAKKARRRK